MTLNYTRKIWMPIKQRTEHVVCCTYFVFLQLRVKEDFFFLHEL